MFSRLPVVSFVLTLGLGLAATPRAHAFSGPTAYVDPLEFGGGMGRFFTGSRADGYACNACHTGGDPAPVQVTGLPVGGFVPGGSYEIIVSWPLVAEHLTLMAEVTGPNEMAAGTLTLPRFDAMMEGERCTIERGGGAPATQIVDVTVDPLATNRQVAGIIDCGATYMRMLWTAPPAPIAGVRFNLGFVSSNNDGDATGDGVTLIDQPLSAGSADGEPIQLVQGCSASGASGGAGHAPLWVGLLTVVLGAIARRRTQGLKP